MKCQQSKQITSIIAYVANYVFWLFNFFCLLLMNCLCGMVDWWNTFSLISSWDRCQRSSPLQISDTPQAGFEPVQNLSSGFVEWSCTVVITTTPRRLIKPGGSHCGHYMSSSAETSFSATKTFTTRHNENEISFSLNSKGLPERPHAVFSLIRTISHIQIRIYHTISRISRGDVYPILFFSHYNGVPIPVVRGR